MLATPVPSHADLAVRVLEAGKHCFVEKPLAQSVADAERAVEAQRSSGKVLMVGHLLQFHPGVNKLKEIADSGELGEIRYIYGNRLNLGKLRTDENALWSLGAHDVSVLLHLAGEEPYEMSARGESYMNPGIEDVVFGFLRFRSGLAAHLHLSWLDPHKERRFTIVGDRRMATFDDMDVRAQDHASTTRASTRAPSPTATTSRARATCGRRRSRRAEPLRLECEHFVACVREGREPISGGAQRPAPSCACSRACRRSLDASRRAPEAQTAVAMRRAGRRRDRSSA